MNNLKKKKKKKEGYQFVKVTIEKNNFVFWFFWKYMYNFGRIPFYCPFGLGVAIVPAH